MSDNHIHPQKILITSEMNNNSTINERIELQGCESFIIEALSEIFVAIHERNPDIFTIALGMAIDKIKESK